MLGSRRYFYKEISNCFKSRKFCFLHPNSIKKNSFASLSLIRNRIFTSQPQIYEDFLKKRKDDSNSFSDNLYKWAERLKYEYSISNQTQTCKTIPLIDFYCRKQNILDLKKLDVSLIFQAMVDPSTTLACFLITMEQVQSRTLPDVITIPCTKPSYYLVAPPSWWEHSWRLIEDT